MSEYLIIRKTSDATNLSKVVVRTGIRELLDALTLRTAALKDNGLSDTIFAYGSNGKELRIYSSLGSSMEVLSCLLDGQDYNRLSRDATIETIDHAASR